MVIKSGYRPSDWNQFVPKDGWRTERSQCRAASSCQWEPAEVMWALGQGASWVTPFEGFPWTADWRLYYLSGLGTLQNHLGGSGKFCWGEGCLQYPASLRPKWPACRWISGKWSLTQMQLQVLIVVNYLVSWILRQAHYYINIFNITTAKQVNPKATESQDLMHSFVCFVY